MKIKKIKWKNHPILGNLLLDFSKRSGDLFDNILFVGENGTGKTTILDSISTFLSNQSFEFFEYVEFSQDNYIRKTFDGRTYSANDFPGIPIGSTEDLIKFSRAHTEKTDSIMNNEDNFSSIKHLIIDLEEQDCYDYVEINKTLEATSGSWNDFFQTSRIYQFKNAFDNFFETIKYNKVTADNSEKSVQFTKNGELISIDKLSTGEKQIVFRGAYLLNKPIKNGCVMIDEPELSMHPKWQRKILKYYKELCCKEGLQDAQLFFATHSDHVLRYALSDLNDNLVIILNDVNGIIQAKRIDALGVLPSITNAETNYLAFDIVSNDYHIELYGWLQRKESKNTVKSCDNFIKNHRLYSSTTHYKPSSFGSTTYDTISTFIRNAIDHPDSNRTFTDAELRISIELLIEICK